MLFHPVFDSFADSQTTTWGFVALAILSICFSCMFLPVKRHNMGNGIFFQWIMCVSMAVIAFIIHLIVGSPRIWPLTVLSGVFWATGNAQSILVIKRLGIGVGMLIWSMVCLLFGWATSRFGWLGLLPEVPRKPFMNYAGVTLAAISAALYVLIEPPRSSAPSDLPSTVLRDDDDDEEDRERLVGDDDIFVERRGLALAVWKLRRRWNSGGGQRLIGVGLAITSGLLFGIVFVPIIYTQESVPGASKRGIDYIGAMGLGVLLTSTFWFSLYAIVTRNNPWIPSTTAIFPSIVSGVLCGIAQACFLVANECLQASVTIPIATTLPGALATLIGTIFYREVQGRRNYMILGVALSFTLCGAILTGLSK